jgi:hypothetical protein
LRIIRTDMRRLSICTLALGAMSLLIAGQPTRLPVSSSEKPLRLLFVVREASKCGYIDTTGRLAIQMAFDDCADFSEGYAPVEISGKWGFIDESGKLNIQPTFDECRWSFSKGLAAVRLAKYWGYINTKNGVLSIVEATS